MSKSIIKRQTELSANIVQFCRFLRNEDYRIGPEEEADALQSLAFIPLGDQETFRLALKSLLARSRMQQEQFDAHFDRYWKELEKAVDSKKQEKLEDAKKRGPNKKSKQASFQALKSWLYGQGKAQEEDSAIASYSAEEVLTKKDFSAMTDDEMRLVFRKLQQIARSIVRKKSRLRTASKTARQLDLKRTIRLNLRKGPGIQQFLFSKAKDKKLKLVLLCDISKSMDLYSRFLIHFIYAFQNAYDRIETFVFSTALHQVSHLLREYEFKRAFELISERIPHWSGGTQIGQSLSDFINKHGHSLLDRRTVVLILSDGWDTGAPSILEAAMQQLHKSAGRVLWLNPLAGSPAYQAEVTGMKTALPYIDVFAAAHNVESLKKVAHILRKGKNRQPLLKH
ncbi:MAG: VWA domain-containing protein [Saprospiraceae bacterium]